MLLTPRKRTMPLVPEPFQRLSISRQSVFFQSNPMASKWARFCPNLNIPQYRETLSQEKKTELDQRTTKLYKRAIANQLYKSSEFSWEVCAWHDVFGLILDDEGLRIDKRPYEFVAKEDDGQNTVKIRVPDATFGLKTYDNYDLKRGYLCTVPDCKVDHSGQQPDKRLSKNRLHAMMFDPECGLVVDGVWGKTDIVFPFAVYEAKKRAGSFKSAEGQIYHACQTYLAMLDDLARNPNNVAEYQTKESSQYQLFAFTSCGSYWEVFLAWNFLDDCTVETLWEGDVKEFTDAYDLICIVDQIHDYVVKHHRPFVLKHLEAWHVRHEEIRRAHSSLIYSSLSDEGVEDTVSVASDDEGLEDMVSVASDDEGLEDMVSVASDDEGLEDMISVASDPSDLESGSDDGDEASWYDAEFVESLVGSVLKPPEWFRLKEAAKISRREKAQRTRARNRELRKPLLEGRNSGNPQQVKRGRGRPPKAGVAKKGVQKQVPLRRSPRLKRG